jgi:hypothetical protein
LHQLLSAELQAKGKQGSIPDLLAELKTLQIPTDGSAPPIKILSTTDGSTGSEQRILLESEPGLWIEATLYVPHGAGRKPAVVIVKNGNNFDGMSKKAIERMDALGAVVLQLTARTTRLQNTKGPYTGDWTSDLQANLIGRSLPAMRAHDILRGVDLLRARQDVDPNSIRGAANGVAGVWMLLAAAADTRLSAIWLDRTPYGLRAALETSMAIGLPDATIPGFALRWDLQDLVKATEPRKILWTDPTNWTQHVVALGASYRYRYSDGLLTDEKDVQDDALIRDFLN